jgi:hypothetical protein
MSDVLGTAAVVLQDAMPSEMRNSLRYKTLLPDMAGTGREHEQERLAILINWMWSVVLPQLQPLANQHGFGSEWQTMCQLKTAASARAAALAASARADYDDVAYAAVRAADYAAAASYAATYAALSAAGGDFLETVDPIGVLERMTYLNVETSK